MAVMWCRVNEANTLPKYLFSRTGVFGLQMCRNVVRLKITFRKAVARWNANPGPLLILPSLASWVSQLQSKQSQPHFLRNPHLFFFAWAVLKMCVETSKKHVKRRGKILKQLLSVPRPPHSSLQAKGSLDIEILTVKEYPPRTVCS